MRLIYGRGRSNQISLSERPGRKLISAVQAKSEPELSILSFSPQLIEIN